MWDVSRKKTWETILPIYSRNTRGEVVKIDYEAALIVPGLGTNLFPVVL